MTPSQPSARLFTATYWRTVTQRCVVYSTPPGNAVPARRVPRLGQVRVRKDDAGRWNTFRDRFRVETVNGRIVRVTFYPGPFCGTQSRQGVTG